jgi:hypothetical protein
MDNSSPNKRLDFAASPLKSNTPLRPNVNVHPSVKRTPEHLDSANLAVSLPDARTLAKEVFAILQHQLQATPRSLIEDKSLRYHNFNMAIGTFIPANGFFGDERPSASKQADKIPNSHHTVWGETTAERENGSIIAHISAKVSEIGSLRIHESQFCTFVLTSLHPSARNHVFHASQYGNKWNLPSENGSTPGLLQELLATFTTPAIVESITEAPRQLFIYKQETPSAYLNRWLEHYTKALPFLTTEDKWMIQQSFARSIKWQEPLLNDSTKERLLRAKRLLDYDTIERDEIFRQLQDILRITPTSLVDYSHTLSQPDPTPRHGRSTFQHRFKKFKETPVDNSTPVATTTPTVSTTAATVASQSPRKQADIKNDCTHHPMIRDARNKHTTADCKRTRPSKAQPKETKAAPKGSQPNKA